MSTSALTRKSGKFIAFFGSLLSFFLLAPKPLLAQENTASPQAPYAAIAITPTSFQVDLKPSQTVTKEFRLRNAGEFKAEYTFSVADVYPEGETGQLNWRDPEAADPHSLANWFDFDRSTVTLAPHEAVKITVSIIAPATAEPGGHYGTIFATGKPADDNISQDSSVVYSVPRLAVNFIATIPGDIIWSGKLVSFEGPKFVSRGPVDFIARFENTGTVHQRPKGTVDFYDMFGRKVGEVVVDSKFIFPNAIRQLPVTWDKIFLIGKYKAVLNLQYGENYKETASSEIEFYALPWQAIVGVIVTIAVLFGLGRLSAMPAKRKAAGK